MVVFWASFSNVNVQLFLTLEMITALVLNKLTQKKQCIKRVLAMCPSAGQGLVVVYGVVTILQSLRLDGVGSSVLPNNVT